MKQVIALVVCFLIVFAVAIFYEIYVNRKR